MLARSDEAQPGDDENGECDGDDDGDDDMEVNCSDAKTKNDKAGCCLC